MSIVQITTRMAPTQAAGEIKIKHGCALPQMLERDEEIEVPSTGDHPPRRISRQAMSEVIRARYEYNRGVRT